MNEKIAKIIADYSSRNMLLDEEGIIPILVILIKELNILDFVKGYTILLDTDEGKKGFYNQDNRTITIYSNRIKNMLARDFGFLPITDQNLIFVRVLIHEINHAKQFKMCFTDDSFEAQLYQDSFGYFYTSFLLHKAHLTIYNRYHDFFPIERMADIDSARICLGISEHLKTELSFNHLYAKFLMADYQEPTKYFSPLEYYAIKTNSTILRRQPFYDKSRNQMLCNVQELYSLDERLRFGLLISDSEYQLIRKPNKS